MVTIDPSYGYTTTTKSTDYFTDITTTTIPAYILSCRGTPVPTKQYATITTTTPTYVYTTSTGHTTLVEKERTIKNIHALKCSCCDAKLNIKKMKDNVIRCEYCDSDNYINIESEVY
jgi:DNA-directed RNA polymerase subunit RPC12/RpoP